jgi:endo-1,4-beta-xylanase
VTRKPPRRRDVLAGLAAAAAAPAATAQTDEPLADVARRHGLLFGTAGGAPLFDDPGYRDLVCRQCTLLTPENAFKFDAFHPVEGGTNFGPADAMLRFADDNALRLRGHTLIWNDNLPDWVSRLSGAELRRVFDEHLETVVPHYAGRLQSWDVVNEPFYLGRDHPGTFRLGPWFTAFGEDYIFRAFSRVAALDPATPLVLNEAWTERADRVGLAVRKSLLALVDRIRDKGLRLDAVGLQAHLQPEIAYDDAGFLDFLHALAARGVDIYLTEFDVNDSSFPDDIETRDRLVAARALAFLSTALREPAVKALVTWGLSDRYSWYRDPRIMLAQRAPHLPRPLPYDDALRPKLLRAAMVEAMRGR